MICKENSIISADPSVPYQHTDLLKQSLVSSIIVGFTQACIPIRRFLISGLKQIASYQIENSGPILIANTQAIMNQQQLNPKILDNIIELKEQQRQLLAPIQVNIEVPVGSIAMNINQEELSPEHKEEDESTQPSNERKYCCIQ